jgi:hypothetical protein
MAGLDNRIMEALSPIIPIFPAHPTAAMAPTDVEMHGSDSDSALNEPLGSATLEAKSICLTPTITPPTPRQLAYGYR